MKINSAEIAFSAHHSLVQKHERRESLVEGVSQNGAWDPSQLSQKKTAVREERQVAAFAETTSLLDRRLAGRSQEELAAKEQARVTARSPQTTSPNSFFNDLELLVQKATEPFAALFGRKENSMLKEATTPFDIETTSQDRIKMQLLMTTLEQLSGKKFDLFEPSELEPSSTEPIPPEQIDKPHTEEVLEAPPQPAWGLHYQYSESHYEAETTEFHAAAQVKTQDGREIAVEVDLTMSRQFASEKQLDVRMGAALQDPLVVNFEGTAAELSQTKYQFDLDADGQEEQIHFAGPNGAFLALDKNGNGAVDDGRELFGPTTGDGFAELAAYDEDQNQWIDESDSIYSQLRVWSRDQTGNSQLQALGQRGIGAIYLGHTATPFEVKDENNQLQAAVRTSGLYLNEDGTAGSVQQIDLAV
jgi:hypothetical protein